MWLGSKHYVFVQDELSHVKRLLQESEESCQNEAARRKEAANQVIKLTELKALLQQQVEEKGGGTVAEKQVKSLETRLRVTEERLHNERADRAGKLSEVENKLINENARQQVRSPRKGNVILITVYNNK